MFKLFPAQFFVGLIQSECSSRVMWAEMPNPPRRLFLALFASNNILSEYFQNFFVVFILLLFLLSLRTLVYYRIRLRSQRLSLSSVQDNYDEVLKARETNPDAICQELLKGVEPGSIAAHRIEELYWIGTHGGDFDQVALADVLAAREAAKTSFAKYISSVLVLLGLCGAIWGLSNLILNMGPALNKVQDQLTSSQQSGRAGATGSSQAQHDSTAAIQESFKTLTDTMATSLGNTRHAFYASLTGILASAALLMLNLYIGREQVKFLSDLEDLTATKLIPLFKPPREATELAGALDAFKGGASFLVGLSSNLDSKVSQVGTSLDNLFAIVRKFGEGSKALQSSQESVHAAQAQMMKVVEQFVQLTGKIEANQVNSGQTVDNLVLAVQESNKNISLAIKEWKEKHQDTMQQIEQNSKQAHAETGKAFQAIEKGIGDIAMLIHTSFDNQMKSFKDEALTLLVEQQTGNREHLEDILKQQGEFVSALQKAVVESNGHRELLDGMTKTITEERNVFSERLDKVLGQNERAINGVISEQKQLLDISGMRKMEERFEGFAQVNQRRFSDLLAKQDDLTNRFGELSRLADRLGSMMRLLIGVATVTIPVFAALGIMFIFNLRPEEQLSRILALVVIFAMIFMLAWFLRART